MFTIEDLYYAGSNIDVAATFHIYNQFGDYLDQDCPVISAKFEDLTNEQLDLPVKYFHIRPDYDEVHVCVREGSL